ncbi:hypothetical protein QBC34DRAFT_374520 [Podospora aff. communis PSN243]|uniref:Uncharacterized protein n=1 Tax=Podospora aff. communis PSN243 TaxID=3040156 RepID=A0AAV9H729_9PEZI|nr:hypothetical protein QBC34DRAFT_374520 [Podospora aff. communis PSN243]
MSQPEANAKALALRELFQQVPNDEKIALCLLGYLSDPNNITGLKEFLEDGPPHRVARHPSLALVHCATSLWPVHYYKAKEKGRCLADKVLETFKNEDFLRTWRMLVQAIYKEELPQDEASAINPWHLTFLLGCASSRTKASFHKAVEATPGLGAEIALASWGGAKSVAEGLLSSRTGGKHRNPH